MSDPKIITPSITDKYSGGIMRIRRLAAITLLSGLSACGTVSTNGQVASNYRESDYSVAGHNRDMWVVVAGSVPGSDAATLQQQTLATMQRYAGIKTHFTATPRNHNREYKTVLLFNGPDNIQASELCRNSNPQVAPASGGDLRLQAVFCRNDQFLTEVHADARGGNSLSNPNFNALIRQTMTGIYAAAREEQRDPDN
jgi:hypothetical protein